MSEFLRVQHGDDEVNEQQNGQYQRDCGYPIHGLPQPLTRLDVEKRQAEENRCEKQHCQILHRNSPSFRKRRDSPASICRGPCSKMILRDGVLGWRKGFLKIK